jgi:Flp pilus assembly protein TadD
MYYHGVLITPWGLQRAPGLHPVGDSMKSRKRDLAGKGRREPAAPRSIAQPVQRFSRSHLFLLAAIFSVTAVALAYFFLNSDLVPNRQNVPSKPLAFVGSETCASCHQKEAEAWRGSHHRHAMAHAADATVRGNFADARFDNHGVQSRFFRRDGKFMVETDGPDGSMQTYEIKYTFGLEPLQQYLIEFPDGRLQALSIAWDTRPKEQGGQRWFHLYPDEKIDHTDILHWTKLNQNWNFMCAECHSTGVRKNYDAKTDTYATKFAEISVGCEACHGQGSRHVSWARNKQAWWPSKQLEDPSMGLLVRYMERLNATWPLDPVTGSAKRSTPPSTLRTEVESCGMCHARRGQISEDWKPGQRLSETHQVSPLTRGLFHVDGQMLDEVFNYASFKQSKMYAAGVTCSDCHDPHSGKPRIAGDGVCLQCHSSEKFSAPSHHRHANLSPAPTCASCHMPVRTYMVVDDRHDHSFRVPRPDLSVTTGAPNTCNDCHKDKTAVWAATAIESWHGPVRKGFQTYAPAFSAAATNANGAGRMLAAVAGDPAVPGIARATALAELVSFVSPELMPLARSSLTNSDPMVRIGALDMLERVPAAQIWPLASPLLRDPVQGVRVRAAQLLAAVPTAQQPANDRRFFDAAAREFVAAQQLNADRPEGRSSLGSFYARRGQIREAEAEFRAALRLSPQFAPAAINLADLLRLDGRDDGADQILRDALSASPRDAGLHHARGLALVRLKRLDDALASLGQAAEIDPAQPRYAYVYAVGLHSAGRPTEALEVLRRSAARHPGDRETLSALMNFAQEARDFPLALSAAEQLSKLTPGNRDLEALIARLKQALQ